MIYGIKIISITGELLHNVSIGCKFSPARRGYGSSGMSHGFSKEASRCSIETSLDISFDEPLGPWPEFVNFFEGRVASPARSESVGVVRELSHSPGLRGKPMSRGR